MTTFETIRVSDPRPGVRMIRIDRPRQRNALNGTVLGEIAAALGEAERDDACGCVVLTGGDTIFAAGADLNDLAARDLAAIVKDERINSWLAVRRFPKPIVAAVNGFALGGGCELAMCADIMIAGDTAQFGQPEINLGIIPGAGGTQRLTRALGKSLAMKMCLTGEWIDAKTALEHGLVAEVVPHEVCVERAVAIAATIAAKPPLAVRMAKEAILKSFETPLEAGLDYERRAFHLLFGSDDKKEGIAAFLEKRKPEFKGR